MGATMIAPIRAAIMIGRRIFLGMLFWVIGQLSLVARKL
jgi:hypothetical protein